MLSTIRKGLGSFFVMALLGLLIASFAIWGVGDVFRTPTLNVAQVGDADIHASEFLREFNARVNAFRVQFGGEFDRDQARSIGIDRQVLSQLIARAAWDEEVRNLGLIGSDQKVARTLRAIQAFHGLNGKFDEFVYARALQRIETNIPDFEASLSNDVARSQLLDTLTATTPLPEAFVTEIYRYRKEARTSRVLTIPASSIGDIAPPDEEVLREYHDFNKVRFMAPEYRNLTILVIRPEDFADTTGITEEDLRAAYEDRLNEYQIPSKRALLVVPFDDQVTARDFYDRVTAGGNFRALASELTGFSANELEAGEKTSFDLKSDYSEVAAEAVFALEIGGISQPIQTILGWYVFRVMEITPGSGRTFEQVEDELRRIVAADRGLDALYDTAAAIDDTLAEGATVEEVGRALKLKVQTFAAIDRSGLNPEGELIAGKPSILTYLNEAFTLDVVDEPVLLEDDGLGFHLVQVNEVIPRKLKPFETVEQEVRAVWLADEANRRAGELADTALGEAQTGVPLDELAKKYKGQLIEAPVILRDEMLGQQVLAPNVARLVFSLANGEVGLERSATGDGYVLVQVTSIKPGDPGADKVRLDGLRARLLREFGNDLFSQYQLALQIDLGVTINQQLLNDLFDPGGGTSGLRIQQ